MDKSSAEVLDTLKAGPLAWRTLSKGRSASWLRAFRKLVREGFIESGSDDSGAPVYSRSVLPIPVEPPPREDKPSDSLADVLARFRLESTTLE
jgi:hypothetical protein